MKYSGGGNTLVWDVYICPRCGGEAQMGLMSLVARCPCGMVYVDVSPDKGWYESMDAYHAGALPQS
jgi:hypothetical protein